MNDVPYWLVDVPVLSPSTTTKPIPPQRDDQEASRGMMAAAQGQATFGRRSCPHFRYRLPDEDAAELRAADPNPCPVCDAIQERRRQVKWLE